MEKIKCLINMIIAFMSYPFMRHRFKGRDIWLAGGNAGELYVDNGRAIYEYVLDKGEVEVYWVVDSSSPAMDKIPGRKLIKGSIESYLYFMNAKAVMFSHSISADIVPYLFVVPVIRMFHSKPLKVFLNHGTVGFKVRMPMNRRTGKIAEALVRSYDVSICDSEYERRIKTETWWNIPTDRAFITGYPRYDRLYNAQYQGRNNEDTGPLNGKNEGREYGIEKKDETGNGRSISASSGESSPVEKNGEISAEKIKMLFMPTWRNWIRLEDKRIEDTEYFRNITGLIQSKELNRYLEERDIYLNVYIHQLMHPYLESFGRAQAGNNVTLLLKEADITEEVKSSKLLITDYSSIAYDFYYLRKPVIFFQFDRGEYEKKVGSYVDLDNELFGEAAYGIDECISKIMEICENDFKYNKGMQERTDSMRSKFLEYTDNENCKRVYELILRKIGEKNGKG